jgi:hypothetical protein
MKRVALLLAGALAIVGCQSLTDGARDDFSHKFSCPKDQVEARTRKDIKAHTLSAFADRKPPADVAADSKRLAVWQADQQKTVDREDTEDVVEARGCSHSQLYTCTRSNTGTHQGAVMCFSHDYPAGMAKW